MRPIRARAVALSIPLSIMLAACSVSSPEPPREGTADQDAALGTCKEREKDEGDEDRRTLDEEEARFLERINAYREELGVEPLVGCRSLHRASQAHSEDMRDAGYFNHKDLEGGLPPDRACDACYNGGCFGNAAVGENIAAGAEDAIETFEQWRNSPGHDKSMRNPLYRVIGIGRALGGEYGAHWTTVFGSDPEKSCEDP